mgnify:CR=1 FL=1
MGCGSSRVPEAKSKRRPASRGNVTASGADMLLAVQSLIGLAPPVICQAAYAAAMRDMELPGGQSGQDMRHADTIRANDVLISLYPPFGALSHTNLARILATIEPADRDALLAPGAPLDVLDRAFAAFDADGDRCIDTDAMHISLKLFFTARKWSAFGEQDTHRVLTQCKRAPTENYSMAQWLLVLVSFLLLEEGYASSEPLERSASMSGCHSLERQASTVASVPGGGSRGVSPVARRASPSSRRARGSAERVSRTNSPAARRFRAASPSTDIFNSQSSVERVTIDPDHENWYRAGP